MTKVKGFWNGKKRGSEIEKRNREWDAADRDQRKVMIAQDVIQLISMPGTNVRPGVYFEGNVSGNYQQAALDGISCNVCARGAMMVSKFRFKGTTPMPSFYDTFNDRGATSIQLEDAFDWHELGNIESIFERKPGYGQWSEEELYKHLESFSNEPDKRLKQIMERIILTKGDVTKALTCGGMPKLVIPI